MKQPTRRNGGSVWAAAFVLLLTPACAEKAPDYAAVVPGVQCEYLVEYRQPGQETRSTSVVARTSETDTIIRGSRYFKTTLIWSGVPGAEPQISYVRRAKNGIYAIEHAHMDKPEILTMPLPLEVGIMWTQKTWSGDSAEYRVEAKEAAELFDRTYNESLRVSFRGRRESGQHYEGHVYLAPDVGFVKRVYRSDGFIDEWNLEQCDR